jgi:hypothetical protein
MPVVQERTICAAMHMITLAMQREVTPYKWVHPEEEKGSEEV